MLQKAPGEFLAFSCKAIGARIEAIDDSQRLGSRHWAGVFAS